MAVAPMLPPPSLALGLGVNKCGVRIHGRILCRLFRKCVPEEQRSIEDPLKIYAVNSISYLVIASVAYHADIAVNDS